MATTSKKKGKGKAPARRKTAPKAARSAPAKKRSVRKEGERSAPTTAEVDTEVLEFIAAIDRFKEANGRPFPSWSEILSVVRDLGYRRP